MHARITHLWFVFAVIIVFVRFFVVATHIMDELGSDVIWLVSVLPTPAIHALMIGSKL
jgi:hypothetical protein